MREQRTENRVQSTENREQRTECRVQSTECRVQSTEYRVQSTEYRVQSTENRVQRTEVLYSSILLILNQLSCIPLVVVLSCSFGGQKNEKPRHRVRQSHDALLMNCRAISFGHICSAKAHSFGNINVPSSQTLLARNGATSILTRI